MNMRLNAGLADVSHDWRVIAAVARTSAPVADLARAVTSSPYLVGDGFTRADLTVASMLAGLVGIPGDELSRSTRACVQCSGCWRRRTPCSGRCECGGTGPTAAIAAAGSRQPPSDAGGSASMSPPRR